MHVQRKNADIDDFLVYTIQEHKVGGQHYKNMKIPRSPALFYENFILYANLLNSSIMFSSLSFIAPHLDAIYGKLSGKIAVHAYNTCAMFEYSMNSALRSEKAKQKPRFALFPRWKN